MKPNQTPNFFSVQIAKASRFHLDMKPSRRVRLSVVSGGLEHCAADYRIHRRTFPYFGIEFVARGEGTLCLHHKIYPLTAGTIFTYGPGIAQQIETDPTRPLVKYFVDFTGTTAGKLLRQHGLAPGQVVQTGAPSEIVEIFDDLIRAGLRNTPYRSQVAALILEQMILRIAETIIPFGSAKTEAFATYRRCREYIELNWERVRTLEQLARNCHVDSAYLCRLFSRFDRQSPYQVLLDMKLRHALTLMAQPGAMVKNVARAAGFEDPYHFSRLFKRRFGLAPQHYATRQ